MLDLILVLMYNIDSETAMELCVTIFMQAIIGIVKGGIYMKRVDSWEVGYRYIDYNAFAYDLASSGFGSFNTAVVK